MTIPAQVVAKPTWEQDCLTFPVNVNGRPIRVFITADALKRRFRAASADMLALEALAKSLIAAGRTSPTGEVRIDKDDVMAVSFGEKLRRSPEHELLARQATRLLEDAIGTSAPQVTAVWDLSEDGRTITLQLSDGIVSIDRTVAHGQLGKDKIEDKRRFIRLWGDLLQERDHLQLRQLQQLQASCEASWRE